ncbi:4'-phosphopantetheinyl transferase family protein [Paenibacillus taichungensis]|uniref:4'-phosphopantetheinyl transferase family protein n=1 Tax=Paenibacillus taichungensis TaxID=484184 RepID=UPI0038D1353E
MMGEVLSNITFTSGQKHFQASLSLIDYIAEEINDVQTQHLHQQEMLYFSGLKFEKRKFEYLAGRLAAKGAVANLINEPERREILIVPGVFNQPVVKHLKYSNISVSITHSHGYAAAIAYQEELLLGIDIERIDLKQRGVLESQCTVNEKKQCHESLLPYDFMLTLSWTVKESLSKILKTGLSIPFQLLEISQVCLKDRMLVSSFKNFPQYCAISFYIKGFVCSIVYPKKLVFSGDSVFQEIVEEFSILN